LCFQIRDWGIGIPLVDQGHLFDHFYRARNTGSIQGTGLGLAIVKKAIHALNGTIQLDSLPGKGTCFTIHLPRMQWQQQTQDAQNLVNLHCGVMSQSSA
jgi:signal transduction histidine kinase